MSQQPEFHTLVEGNFTVLCEKLQELILDGWSVLCTDVGYGGFHFTVELVRDVVTIETLKQKSASVKDVSKLSKQVQMAKAREAKATKNT